METFFVILGIIIFIPIFCDMVISESHICSYILNKIPIYRKISSFFEETPWLLIPLCLIVVFPLCFYWGYSVSKEPQLLIGEYAHTSPKDVNWNLRHQIIVNDSMFCVKIANKDSIVFDRINNKLVHTAKKEYPTENYNRYIGKNAVQILLLGAIVIPTWNEVTSTANFATFSKKAWGFCLMAAGYLGFNQGYKCKQTILKNNTWNTWLNLQEKLHNENWWIEFSKQYPYYKEEYIIDVNSPIGGGLGISFEIENDTIVVKSVGKGFPAEQSGVIEGDKIISIDRVTPYESLCESYKELNLDIETAGADDIRISAYYMLRGEVNSDVRLEILRGNSNSIIYIDATRVPVPLHFLDVVSIPEDVI